MEGIKKGVEVFLVENTRVIMGLQEGLVYSVVDVLENVEYPIVLRCEELGKDWVEFVNEYEVISSTP